MPDLDRVLDDAMALPYDVRMCFLDVILELMEKDIFHPALNTHKLGGKAKGC